MAEQVQKEQQVQDVVESTEDSEGVTHKVVEATTFGVVKATLATGHGLKVAGTATGHGTAVAAKATGRWFRKSGKGIKSGVQQGVAKAKGILEEDEATA